MDVEAELLGTLSLFDLSRAELEPAGDAADLRAIAGAFSHDCQKLSLLALHGELPPWDSPHGQDLAKKFAGLCFEVARQCALRSAGGCKAFRATTREAFQALLEASVVFFRVISDKKPQEKDIVVRATAAVMEKCKLLETMPRDNRTATSRALVKLGAAIKDVVRELGEMKEAEARPSGEDMAGEEDEDEDCDFDPDFDEAEARRAALVAPLAEAALQLLKPVIRALLDAPEPSGGDADGLARLDALCTVYKQIALASEEVGASLYPPQEIDSLRQHSSALASGASAFGQLASEMAGLGAEARGAIQKAVEDVGRAREAFALSLTGSCAEAA